MNIEDLFEEGDDIFSGGSPEKKFFEVIRTANKNIVEQELERVYERFAALEMMLEEQHGDAFEKIVTSFIFTNAAELDTMKKSMLLQSVGNIVTRCE